MNSVMRSFPDPKASILTRTLVDFVNKDLAFGRTSFLIVWSLMYLFIVLKTLMAASCPNTTTSQQSGRLLLKLSPDKSLQNRS